jgi:hypothetical protein
LKRIKNGLVSPTPEITYVKSQKLFKDTNLKVAFKMTTTIGKLLRDTRTTNTRTKGYTQNDLPELSKSIYWANRPKFNNKI